MRVCSRCHLHVREENHQPCGAGVSEVAADGPGQALQAKFSDLVPIARGRGGTLFRGTNRETGEAGVLKLVDQAVAGGRPERVRLKRELRKQLALRSPVIARVLAHGESEGQPWVFREWVPGESLALRLARLGPLSTDDAISVVVQLAIALDELHRNGLVHRDLKPSHIILREDADEGQAVLVDVGLASPVGVDGMFSVIGTPGYMSPEQARGRLLGYRSDLFSLGCVFYELVAGHPLYTVAGGPPYDPTTLTPSASCIENALAELELPLAGPVRDMLQALMNLEARKRPFSAQQVRRTLEPFLNAPLPHALHGHRVSRAPLPVALTPAPPPPPSVTSGEPTYELDLEELGLALGEADVPSEWLSSEELELLHLEAVGEDSRHGALSHVAAAESESAVGAAGAQAAAGAQVGQQSAVRQLHARGSQGSSRGALQQPRGSDGGSGIWSSAPSAARTDRDSVGSARLQEAASGAAQKSAQGRENDESASEVMLDVEGPESAAAARPSRRPVVNFDVESLFREDAFPQVQTADEHSAAPESTLSGQAAPQAHTLSEGTLGGQSVPPKHSAGQAQVLAGQVAEASAIEASSPERAPEDDAGSGASRQTPPESDSPQALHSIQDFQAEDPGKGERDGKSDAPTRFLATAPTTTTTESGAGGSPLAHMEADEGASPAVAAEGEVHLADRFRAPWARVGDRRWFVVGGVAAVLLLSGLWAASGDDDEGDAVELAADGASTDPGAHSAAESASTSTAIAAAEQPPAKVAPTDAPEVATDTQTVQAEADTEGREDADGRGEAAGGTGTDDGALPTEPSFAQSGAEEQVPGVGRAFQVPEGAEEPEESVGDSRAARRMRRAEARQRARAEKAAKKAAARRSTTAQAPGKQDGAAVKAEALALYQQQQYGAAAKAYRQATELRPRDAGAFAGWGASLLAIERPGRAIKAYQQAIRLQPETSGFYAALGRAYYEAGQASNALRAYRKALELNPNNRAANAAVARLDR